MKLKKDYVVPIWERYLLTIDEAAEYFGIGANKIRSYIEELENDYMHDDSGFVLHNGNRTLVKRRKFEEYLDGISGI